MSLCTCVCVWSYCFPLPQISNGKYCLENFHSTFLATGKRWNGTLMKFGTFIYNSITHSFSVCVHTFPLSWFYPHIHKSIRLSESVYVCNMCEMTLPLKMTSSISPSHRVWGGVCSRQGATIYLFITNIIASTWINRPSSSYQSFLSFIYLRLYATSFIQGVWRSMFSKRTGLADHWSYWVINPLRVPLSCDSLLL